MSYTNPGTTSRNMSYCNNFPKARQFPLDRTSQMFSGRKFRWRGRPVTREARAASAFQFWKAAALPGVDACRDPSRAPPITLAVGLPIVS